jgi:hypothetical protein
MMARHMFSQAQTTPQAPVVLLMRQYRRRYLLSVQLGLVLPRTQKLHCRALLKQQLVSAQQKM